MTALRIGSLFTGTGALDLAVTDVLGGEVVWHSQYEPPDKNGREDTNQYAARVLARHWPDVPNLGDITHVDWRAVVDEHGPIDVLTGGFPCQDVSSAGQRAGLTPDSRSGLWTHMARAISVLRPRMVVIENVEGLLSAKASGDVEPCPHCVGDADDEPPLRALGAVLGDLAALGFDAEWCRVAASEVGAPHPRKRVFVLAWPTAVHAGGLGRGHGQGVLGGLGPAGRDAAVQDADGAARGERRVAAPGQAQERRARADAGGRGGAPAAHPGGAGLEVRGVEHHGPQRPAAERGRGEPAPDTDSVESERRGVAGVLGGQAATEPGEGRQRKRAGHAAGDSRTAPADAEGDGRDEGRPEPARQQRGPDAAERRRAALNLRPGKPDIDWGPYAPAIRRWEPVIGRPAPWPTDALGRLSPVFTEWLMGLPDGWVTCTPTLTRPAMLRALGNGVVPAQAAAALRLLLARTPVTEGAAA